MKLDLLTNATVVDDAIRFVEEKFRDRSNDEITQGNESNGEITNKIF
jgi:hypothetical protein